jgi:hypothetical protein
VARDFLATSSNLPCRTTPFLFSVCNCMLPNIVV